MINPYVKNRFNKLIAHDKIRSSKLLEILQYGTLYSIVSLFVGYYINKLFPEFDQKNEIKKTKKKLIIEVILQSLLAAYAVFYIRKLVKLFPFVFSLTENYRPNGTSEFDGEIIIAIIFVATQTKIMHKIEYLME